MTAAILTPILLAIGALSSSGCGTCASDCPAFAFEVVASPGENLDVATAQWTGPGCPTSQPDYCAGDAINGLACVRLTIAGINQPGTCRLDLTFNGERAPFSVTTEFGPETHQGCCHGLPVVGPTYATVPPLHPTAADGGPDGPDGADASPDAGAMDAPAAEPDGSSEPDSGNDQT